MINRKQIFVKLRSHPMRTIRFYMRLKIIIGIKCLLMIYQSGVCLFREDFFRIILLFNETGVVGEMDESGKSAYIWTHKKFEIGYNDQRIIDVNLTSEAKVQLQPNIQIPFSYEVVWKPVNTPFVKRFDKYLDPGFFQHKVKRLSQ